jgi:hypothetical protein
MEHQIAILRSQQEHTVVRRAAECKQDAGAIAGAYRTLSYLFDAFQVSFWCKFSSSTDKYRLILHLQLKILHSK